jgi:hypothetical protein
VTPSVTPPPPVPDFSAATPVQPESTPAPTPETPASAPAAPAVAQLPATSAVQPPEGSTPVPAAIGGSGADQLQSAMPAPAETASAAVPPRSPKNPALFDH